MRRGFKSKAEQVARSIREDLGLGALAPLCPWKLASHLSLTVLTPHDLPLAANDIEQLTVKDSTSWSGITVKDSGLTAVVLNPSHSLRRQRSTLMHEIAHIYLGHVGNRVDVSVDGVLLVSDFSSEQEDEADWLAGALLAPREALLRACEDGKSSAEICEHYGISSDLCTWRLRMTGIEVQLQHRRRKSTGSS